jgi:hypothetical protein
VRRGDSKKLTDQQRYLLARIPGLYQLNEHKPTPEPAEVKRARKIVDKWEKQEALLECQHKKRNEALIIKAKETVYFDTPEKALRIIQQCEKLLKGCPIG